MPVLLSSSSSKIALYMPMQPSSKTPMMAFSARSSAASASPSSFSGLSGSSGSGRTCDASCVIEPVSVHSSIPARNQSSVKSTDQIVA